MVRFKGGSRNLRRGGAISPLTFPSSPLPLPFPSAYSCLSLRSIATLNQLRDPGSAISSSVGSGAEPRPKTNLVHSKAVRKPLVAIILNILSTMLYVFEEINWRWRRRNTVPLSHIMSRAIPWVTASLRRPRGGRAPPPLNPPLSLAVSTEN